MRPSLSPYAVNVLEGILQGAALAAVMLSLSMVVTTVLDYRTKPQPPAVEDQLHELEARVRELEAQVHAREARLLMVEAILQGRSE